MGPGHRTRSSISAQPIFQLPYTNRAASGCLPTSSSVVHQMTCMSSTRLDMQVPASTLTEMAMVGRAWMKSDAKPTDSMQAVFQPTLMVTESVTASIRRMIFQGLENQVSSLSVKITLVPSLRIPPYLAGARTMSTSWVIPAQQGPSPLGRSLWTSPLTLRRLMSMRDKTTPVRSVGMETSTVGVQTRMDNWGLEPQ